MLRPLALLTLTGWVSAGNVLYNGFIPNNYTEALLDANASPYTTYAFF